MKAPDYKGSCIYVIKNNINEKCYIGSAYHFNNRKYAHDWKLRKGIHVNTILQNFVNKYGIDSLHIEILEKVEDAIELIKREQWYIDNHNSEFNILKIAGTDYHIERKRKDETKKLISDSRKDFKYTDESKKKMSETRIRKIAEGQLNSKLTAEQVKEIKTLLKEGKKGKDLALQFNVKPSQISNIKKERCWTNITID